MNRHFISRHVVVNEIAQPGIDGELLHQRRTKPHGHRADHLATRGFRVQNAARRADSQHPAHANFAGRHIHAHFDEMPGKGGLLILFIEIAELDAVFGTQRPGIGKRGVAVPSRICPSANSAVSGLKPSLPATASRSFTQAA